MIIATAGHVDHGKTLLVEALTGVNADRLPEEKRRGMTIDLGFAYLPIEGGPTLGFIDVPGHERFIHNMLAGVAGIDFVLFVIAADDGPMPQTREHLAILDLLGVRRGAVALTKVDRVDANRRIAAIEEVTELLASSGLANAPVFPVSVVTGEGVADLKRYLEDAAKSHIPRMPSGNFRMAIDRAFTVSGVGFIVTGTVFSGRVKTNDEVSVLGSRKGLRARSIHAQNTFSQESRAGQRCAVNLAGPELDPDQIRRSDWLVSGNVPDPAVKFDVFLRVLSSETKALANWTPVHVHAGVSDVLGRVVPLESASIAPGGSGLAQLVLEAPVGVVFGDRVILRDQSARRTIGGGHVVDIFPPKRGRSRPERIRQLLSMNHPDSSHVFRELLKEDSPSGLHLGSFEQNRNLTKGELAEMSSACKAKVVRVHAANRVESCAYSPKHWKQLKGAFVHALSSLHARDSAALRRAGQVFGEMNENLSNEVETQIVDDLLREQVIVNEGGAVRLVTHQVRLTAQDEALWTRLEATFAQDPLKPPTVKQLAQTLGVDIRSVESCLQRVARSGRVARISRERYFLSAAVRHYAKLVADLASRSPNRCVTAAALRDQVGTIGRHLAIEVLEHFDRVQFTRREGDVHFLRDTGVIMAAAPSGG